MNDRSVDAAMQPAVIESASHTLQAATECMTKSQFSRALLLGAAAGKLPGCEALAARLATLRLVCRLHLGSAQRSTTAWKLLGLEENATAASIRRAFRKGAQRIHPDKCNLPGAEIAFTLLAAAADTALAAAAISAPGSSDGVAATAAASGGLSPERCATSDHYWWGGWDPSPSKERHRTRASKRQRSPGISAGDTVVPDADRLTSLSLQDLKTEVTRRQAAVLQPLPGSDESAMDPLARQGRLRDARELLSARLKADKARQLADSAGGFCNDTVPGVQS